MQKPSLLCFCLQKNWNKKKEKMFRLWSPETKSQCLSAFLRWGRLFFPQYLETYNNRKCFCPNRSYSISGCISTVTKPLIIVWQQSFTNDKTPTQEQKQKLAFYVRRCVSIWGNTELRSCSNTSKERLDGRRVVWVGLAFNHGKGYANRNLFWHLPFRFPLYGS